MKITQEEMEAANVPHEHRDYCAHLYVDWISCRRDNAPYYGKCKHQLHLFHDCQNDE